MYFLYMYKYKTEEISDSDLNKSYKYGDKLNKLYIRGRGDSRVLVQIVIFKTEKSTIVSKYSYFINQKH